MFKLNEYIEKDEDLLLEAKLSPAGVDKALKIMFKLMRKRFGMDKVFRFGGPDGEWQFSTTQTGYLFFIRNGSKTKGVRFNMMQGEFLSASIWKNFKIGKKANYTIDFKGLNLLQIFNLLMDYVQKDTIKPGKIAYYAINESSETPESHEFLTEARRSTPEEFVEIVKKGLESGEKINAMTWTRLCVIASEADIQIPSYVKSQVSGPRGQKVHDVIPAGGADNLSATAAAPLTDPVYFIKITAQDPNTKKFLSIKDDKKALELTKKINDNLTNPPSKQDMKVEAKDPNTLFGHMCDLVRLVTRKVKNSLLVYGGPGLGKSYMVFETLKQESKVKDKDWFLIKGRVTTPSLYQTLFLHRDNKIILFDDADSIWKDTEAANILKAALDTYDERTISWYSARTQNVSKLSADEKTAYNERAEKSLLDGTDATEYDENGKEVKNKTTKLPSEFVFESQIIFISNLKYDDFDPAVMTRSVKIDMTLTAEQIFHRIESILDKLGSDDVPFDEKKKILALLKNRFSSGKIDSVSMRAYLSAEQCYRSGLPNWEDLLEYS